MSLDSRYSEPHSHENPKCSFPKQAPEGGLKAFPKILRCVWKVGIYSRKETSFPLNLSGNAAAFNGEQLY